MIDGFLRRMEREGDVVYIYPSLFESTLPAATAFLKVREREGRKFDVVLILVKVYVVVGRGDTLCLCEIIPVFLPFPFPFFLLTSFLFSSLWC